MSGLATVLGTYVGISLSAALPDVAPSRFPLSEPPQAVSSGIPPATAAVATAVEARKLLRLGPEEAAFSVIASTLQGAPGHPAVGRVSRVELAELKRTSNHCDVIRSRSASMLQ
jgi:hypothetical protein